MATPIISIHWKTCEVAAKSETFSPQMICNKLYGIRDLDENNDHMASKSMDNVNM